MKKIKICLLGASGNIGTQSIDCINKRRDEFVIKAISIGNNIAFLRNFLKNNKEVEYICLKNYEDYLIFKDMYSSIRFYYGNSGLLELIEESGCDYILNALSGFSGVMPSLKALKLNKILLLSNKETLVVAGEIVKKYLNNGYGKLYPIDSEHAAITKCLKNVSKDNLETIYLTCSGGPFFNFKEDDLKKVTLENALNHPTYKMGKKITIDSSTLMNKAFEIVEAYYLFDCNPNQIKVKIDRQSYVHSFIKTKDNHYKLSVGKPDMHTQINDSLSLFITTDKEFKDTEIDTYNNYTFYEVDYKTFSLINLGYEIINKKGNLGLIVNASNEVAVNAFLNNEINYFDIKKIIDKILKSYKFNEVLKEEDLVKEDKKVRELTLEIIKKGDY